MLPDKIKAKLFDALNLNMLYRKEKNQVTCFATTATPYVLAAIIAATATPNLQAFLAHHPGLSDLAHEPGCGPTS